MNVHVELSILKQALYEFESRELIYSKLEPKHFYGSNNKEIFKMFLQAYSINQNVTVEYLMPKFIEKGLLDGFLEIDQTPSYSNNLYHNINLLIKEHLEYEAKLALETGDGYRYMQMAQEKEKLTTEAQEQKAIYDPNIIVEQINMAAKDGLNIEMFSTGINGLDKYYKIIKQQTTIITGIPSAGKSNFVDAVCANLVYRYKWRILMFSPENQPLKLHLMNIARKFAGEPVMGTGKPFNHKIITDYFTFINSNAIEHSLELLLRIADKINPDLFVIDPWNEINVTKEPETQFISESLSKIKAFSYNTNCHIIIVAHPTKLRKAESGPYKGQYPPASAYDINGSAMWYNKPDNILSIWRDAETNANELHVQKIKFENVTGIRGLFPMKYDINTGNYSGK